MEQTPLFQPANLKRRFLAYAIDGLLIFLSAVVVQMAGFFLANSFAQLVSVFVWLASIFYSPIMINRFGGTFGKKWLGLRVVNATDQTHVNFGRAILREWVGKTLSGLIFNLGYFWSLIDKRGQGWQDKIANTIVIATDSNGNPIPVQELPVISNSRKVFFGIIVLLQALAFLILPALVFAYLFFARPIQIRGIAMEPNYKDNQYFFSSPIYKYQTPKRGDVIIFARPSSPSVDIMKRVVGLPGETIKISSGNVYINDVLLDESAYLVPGTKTDPENFLAENQPFLIPEGEYFVMGDYRLHSSDSREYGSIKKETIVSRVTFCYWNCNK